MSVCVLRECRRERVCVCALEGVLPRYKESNLPSIKNFILLFIATIYEAVPFFSLIFSQLHQVARFSPRRFFLVVANFRLS